MQEEQEIKKTHSCTTNVTQNIEVFYMALNLTDNTEITEYRKSLKSTAIEKFRYSLKLAPLAKKYDIVCPIVNTMVTEKKSATSIFALVRRLAEKQEGLQSYIDCGYKSVDFVDFFEPYRNRSLTLSETLHKADEIMISNKNKTNAEYREYVTERERKSVVDTIDEMLKKSSSDFLFIDTSKGVQFVKKDEIIKISAYFYGNGNRKWNVTVYERPHSKGGNVVSLTLREKFDDKKNACEVAQAIHAVVGRKTCEKEIVS